jgi:hypothetical protein
MLTKIAGVTKPEEAKSIWAENSGAVSIAAGRKYKELGGK